MTSKKLDVFLTVDVGPSDANLGSGHHQRPDWERTIKGLILLNDVFNSIEEETQNPLHATWFIRSDRIVYDQFSDRMAILELFWENYSGYQSAKHEVGWLPQVYSCDSSRVDYEDLELTHTEWIVNGIKPKSVRMGDCYHDNKTMACIDRLGLKVDSSAVPGRKKNDSGWNMNWVGTPNLAYRPALDDYRIPGKPSRRIIELPLTVLSVKAPYDSIALPRYFNPCMHKSYVWPGLERLVAKLAYIVCVIHPDEVCLNRNGHPLIAYSPAELKFNLLKLSRISESLGRKVEYKTAQSISSVTDPMLES